MSLADEDEFVTVLYYGLAGSAKTSNACAGAKRGKVIVVDAEAGLKRRALADLGIPTEQIDPYREITYDALDGLFWDVKEQLDEDPGSIYAVVWDSVTEICKKLIEQITDKEFAKVTRKAERRGEAVEDLDPFFVDRAYYGTMAEQVRRLVRHFRDLPCHFVLCALERRDVDEDTGKVAYGPAVIPSLQTDLMGYADLVIHTMADDVDQDGNDVFIGNTRPIDKHEAKDRYHATFRTMVSPTLDRVVDFVNGDLSRTAEPGDAEFDQEQADYRELRTWRLAEEEREAARKKAEREARRQGRTGKRTAGKQAARKPASIDDGADDEDGDGDD